MRHLATVAVCVAALAARVPAQTIRVPMATWATGTDRAGNLLPDGALDTAWWMVEPGRYAVVIQSGWPIPPWMPNTDVSKWIGWRGDAAKGSPAGWTTFRTSFELPTGFSRTVLTGRLAADNAAELIVNGGAAAATPYKPIAENFTQWTMFTTSTALRPGRNVLEIRVYNWPWPAGVPPETANPAGLRLEMTATAEFDCPTCPPPTPPETETWKDRFDVVCPADRCLAMVVETTWPPRSTVEVYRNGGRQRSGADYMEAPIEYFPGAKFGKRRFTFARPFSTGETIELHYKVPARVGYTVLGLDPASFPGRIP